MLTIYKYPIPIQDEFVLEMPGWPSILCVQEQYDTPCIWAVVEPEDKVNRIGFYLRGTGHPMGIAKAENYVGTFQLGGGRLVFHLFRM